MAPSATSPKLKLYATGSGFYVSAEGHIVTNQHVVDGCKEMRFPEGQVLQLLAVDKANDLALLKGPKPDGNVARFRDGRGVRTGDAILIAGFPLHDEISRIWQEHRRTVVLITNDVDEGVLLADYIVPLSAGPEATLGPRIPVDLPRPRHRQAGPARQKSGIPVRSER